MKRNNVLSGSLRALKSGYFRFKINKKNNKINGNFSGTHGVALLSTVSRSNLYQQRSFFLERIWQGHTMRTFLNVHVLECSLLFPDRFLPLKGMLFV